MNKINFTINGESYSLTGSEVSPSTSLNDYLRNTLGLVGTKAMCHEGGCGACVVSVAKTHPGTYEKHVVAVNSCLVHVLSCHEWDITTIEGVGNRKDGYNELQSRLAAFNGTQCGYCTPGMIMNMYSLYEGSEKRLTMHQVERAFAGNICRCTGYRPILDAFKSFATDVVQDGAKIKDVEDLHEMQCANKCAKKCTKEEKDWCFIHKNSNENLFDIQMDVNRWYKAYSVEDVFKVLTKEGSDSYRLVAGNTGKGVFPTTKEPRVFIDVTSISTLKDTIIDANLVLGAGLSIHELMAVFQRQMNNDNFRYLEHFHRHLELVANVPVKNIGTIGGNLAMKNAHHDFPSDVFLIFETVNAVITLVDSNFKYHEMNLQKFLATDLKDKLIVNVKIPPLSENHLIRTYKIMPRAQNAHAIVNAGFHFTLDADEKVVSSTIVYGSIASDYTHATNVENYLRGQILFNEHTLQKALELLEADIKPVENLPEPSPACRKAIALGLFYKAILSLHLSTNPRYKSGGIHLKRPVSHGSQTYDTDKSVWPLNQPVPKLEALTQCSGEALYVGDSISTPRDLHVAFVLSTICLGEIVKIDASEALKIPGVVGFFSAKDIPGKNNFTPKDIPSIDVEEEIFASKKITFYGQPIGIVAAVTRKLALKAAGLVRVSYKKNPAKPVLTIKDVLAAPDKDKRILEAVTITATDRGTDTAHVIKGDFYIPDQYHFTMETQSSTVSPTRRGLRVRSATQWMDLVQVAVAKTLNLPLNRVDVEVPRLGGAYGGKASRASLIACACALVAYKLNRKASLVMPLTDNMEVIGKRMPAYFEYELGVNNDGVIQYADVVFYSDGGSSINDNLASYIADPLSRLYNKKRWNIKGYSVITDKPSNTWCRAPATAEGFSAAEHIMERIADATKKDPIEVRTLNITAENSPMLDLVDTFKIDCEYETRRAVIDKFNSENAWKKKGLQVSLMSYPIEYDGNFPVAISVYHADGTILIAHGGIEMGQGINTKVAQVCAYALKVPLSMVTVKGADTFISPNAMATNGSITSESIAFATVKACNELLSRLEPAKADLNEPTWQEIVTAAYNKGISLQVSAMSSNLDKLTPYSVYGACTAEVELDVLTGNHVLTRVDLVEDTGRSLSPEIDVGQIEGAFIMGLGLWTSEKLVYDPSGRLLTNRTWTYKPPGACDIPVDFRVSFKRNSLNNNGVLRSKATGEPALVLAVVVMHALHETIVEARKEYGYHDTEWVHVDTPYCVENIIQAISPNIACYHLK
ncbi:xanthine dehydrogenase-like isoform X1 [Maniola jurtina]|uniref:xanthine dehydrogenase-like isoform X1 n=2 Tax=Maniola jurtina TaxID=191418 RepID=UPI001E68F2B7|nr:xanthine dehydrogenase-like isoform X1 [Maniola jurtina]XP_045774055.1 xanthine dehydrogenase-like isoform X1 [Maniola jurtina]XP_045774056.1 xanthine dehydrogenase-like isoform X1 [Maniola jurtina]XP_045774058.1 xanthine dehydrogenase-like isoform X1 [Maniola jurtina]XP_045774059.1 xanthine dehydrogenase-like isoform X1 [Maniola jurtina]XP_045774060.1 xanthine dehydrogenase-like isoform X1 [Maniola jurtina]